jgi:hypothetical protein
MFVSRKVFDYNNEPRSRMPNKPRGRIEAAGVGIGAVSDELLERRARDLLKKKARKLLGQEA